MSEGTFPALDTHELAWAAGFFDGEGNIRAKPNKQHSRIYWHPVIFVPQIDPQVLERFRRAVGGIGKVSGPWDRTRYAPNRQPQWYYEVYSFERAQAVTALLWTWLSPVKREQARATFAEVKAHPKPSPQPQRTCSIESCGEPHRARGWCQWHYHCWQRDQRWAMLPLRRCDSCGHEFQPRRKTRMYCSPNCKQRACRQRKAANVMLTDVTSGITATL